LRLKYQICTPSRRYMARLVCRKCGIEFPLERWEEVAEVQRISAGRGTQQQFIAKYNFVIIVGGRSGDYDGPLSLGW